MYLFLIFFLSLSSYSSLFSMEGSNLTKRSLTEANVPKAKKIKLDTKSAVLKLQHIARSNIDFSADLKEIYQQQPSIADEFGNTLLHYAVLYHNENLLRELLSDENPGINAINLAGETPLVCAVMANNVTAVKLFLQMGPEISSVYQAFMLAPIVNPELINDFEIFLLSRSHAGNWKNVCAKFEIGKLIQAADQNKIVCGVMFQQYQIIKERILNMPEFLEKLAREDDQFGEKKLDPKWPVQFEEDFLSLIKLHIEDQRNYSVFTNFFSKEQQEEYFYVFLELFFGEDDAYLALSAHGPRREPVDLSQVTWEDLRDTPIPAPAEEEEEAHVVSDEIIELIKKAPALGVKLTKHYLEDKKITSLRKIFSAMPWWFINIQDNNRVDLLRKSLTKNRLNGDDKFFRLFLSYDGFNINRPFGNYNETILEHVLLGGKNHRNIDIFNLLLEYKPNLNCKDNLGRSILMNALTKMPFFEQILNNNPDLTLTDPIGLTVINHAIIDNNCRALKLLLQKIKDTDPYEFDRERYIRSANSNLEYCQERKNAVDIMRAGMILEEVKRMAPPRILVFKKNI